MTHTFPRTLLRSLSMAGFAAAILSGCAGSSDKYPSLAVRDAERQAGVFTPTTPPPPVVPVISGTDLASIVKYASNAHAEFRAAQPGVTELAEAARGLGVESNAYGRAAAAIATLSTLRGQTVAALGSLDELETEAATTFAPVEDIRIAQTEIEAMISEQSAVLNALSAGLAR